MKYLGNWVANILGLENQSFWQRLISFSELNTCKVRKMTMSSTTLINKGQHAITMTAPIISIWSQLTFLMQRNWVLITNSNFLIPIFIKPDVLEFWNFKLCILHAKSNSPSLNCQRFKTPGFQDIKFRKLELSQVLRFFIWDFQMFKLNFFPSFLMKMYLFGPYTGKLWLSFAIWPNNIIFTFPLLNFCR